MWSDPRGGGIGSERDADAVARGGFLHRRQQRRTVATLDHAVSAGQPFDQRGIEPLEVMQQPMGGQDRQPRVRHIHKQHQDIVEGRVGRCFGVIRPLLVAEIQRGLIPMMPVGNVQPRCAEERRKLVKALRPGDRPDRVLIAVLACDGQAGRLLNCRCDDWRKCRLWILIEREDRAQVGPDRARE